MMDNLYKENIADISNKRRLFTFKNPENVVVITDKIPNADFARGIVIDVLIVKREIWKNDEELRKCLLPCLVYNESSLILI